MPFINNVLLSEIIVVAVQYKSSMEKLIY